MVWRLCFPVAVLAIAACGAPAKGTRDFENWCYVEKYYGRVREECREVFEVDERQRIAARQNYAAKQTAKLEQERAQVAAIAEAAEAERARHEAYVQRRRDEIAEVERTNPHGACVMSAQLLYDLCTDPLRGWAPGAECKRDFDVAVVTCRERFRSKASRSRDSDDR
jgi:hypothetical protein